MKQAMTGFGRVCITPPLGTPIVGYYMERRVSGVLDDVYAATVAISCGIVTLAVGANAP